MTSVGSLSSEPYEALIAPIWEYLAQAASPRVVDAVFVFGGIDLHVPMHAANLILDGYADCAVITGSAGALSASMWASAESDIFASYMKRVGVSEQQIVLEPLATNTGENVSLGMQALLARISQVSSLLLVAKPFLMRRCLATFAQQFPTIDAIPCPPTGSMLHFVDRPRDRFARRLIEELKRLEAYAARGFIQPQVVPASVTQLAVNLEAELDGVGEY